MKAVTSFAGLNGFVWWIGVVENRMDPLNMGRCQIRVFGWHTDNLAQIPTADLPWCQAITGTNNSDVSKAPHEGEWVFGFFLDGESGQMPLYMGVIPGIPHVAADQSKGFSDQRTSDQVSNSPSGHLYPLYLDEPTTSRLYRNEKIDQTIIQKQIDSVKTGIPIANGGTWDQPKPAYATVPPYNDVKETESGHVMEFDDTKGAERIHIYHKSGTFEELRPDGSKIISVIGDNYTISLKDDNLYVSGKLSITADGDINLKSGGKLNIQIDSDADINVSGDVNMTVSGKFVASASEFDLTGPVNVTGPITATEDITAGTVSLQNHKTTLVKSGSDLSGPPLP